MLNLYAGPEWKIGKMLSFIRKDWSFLAEKYLLRKHRRQLHEPQVLKTAKKIHGRRFIDIGSNQGIYREKLKKNFTSILTIDPNPKWNADLQIALSDFNGHAPFYVWHDNGSADSLLQNPHILGETWFNNSQYDVEVRTFDSLNLNADLVKIDVEGAEFQVLNGIQKHLPANIIVELHDERRHEALVNLLESKGYSVKRIDDTHYLGQL